MSAFHPLFTVSASVSLRRRQGGSHGCAIAEAGVRISRCAYPSGRRAMTLKALFGGVLIAAGILIASGSGLCTVYFVSGSDSSLSEWLSAAPLILLWTGAPMAFGVWLAVQGRRMIREGSKDA
jgi:hypothetical protein